MVLKLIKSTPFDTNGVKGITYTCAKAGRVLNVSSLSFQDEGKDALVADDKAMTLTISCKVETVASPYVDMATGAIKQGLQVLPALGLEIAQF